MLLRETGLQTHLLQTLKLKGIRLIWTAPSGEVCHCWERGFEITDIQNTVASESRCSTLSSSTTSNRMTLFT